MILRERDLKTKVRVSARSELLPRVELGTSSLPRMRSTTELKQQRSFYHISFRSLSESGRRGSNPRPPAWKASALSTELLPQYTWVWAKMDSNHRRRKPADLQSAPFGHSGICPCLKFSPTAFSLRFLKMLPRNGCKGRHYFFRTKCFAKFFASYRQKNPVWELSTP